MTGTVNEKTLTHLTGQMERLSALLERMLDIRQGTLLGERIDDLTAEMRRISAGLEAIGAELPPISAALAEITAERQFLDQRERKLDAILSLLGAPMGGGGPTG